MKYPHLVIANPDLSLDLFEIEDVSNTFAEAAKVWGSRGCPEMWLFSGVGTAPWHVSGLPIERSNKNDGKRKRREK